MAHRKHAAVRDRAAASARTKTTVDPQKEINRLKRQRREARQQQAATADILKIISRSAFNLQTVLDTLLETAARLCNADIATIRSRDGDVYRLAATYGCPPAWRAHFARYPTKPDRGSVFGRAIVEGRTVHIPDVLADTEFSRPEAQKLMGFRAALGVPMLRERDVVGVLNLFRFRPRSFTSQQIKLVETFADQAAIAVVNARLLDEVEARSAELTESLQQQTATADVLKVISRSAFDLQTVLDTLTESAARLCDADMAGIARQEADGYRHVTNYNLPLEWVEFNKTLRLEPGRGSVVGRVLLEGKVVQVHDVLADPEYSYPAQQKLAGYRTVLGVPLLRDGNPIGVLFLARNTPSPFTDKQIELVTTFADQAVIAIENVRLFDEVQARERALKETLEQQTATSEVLSVISRSTSKLQPVVDTIVETAARLCQAESAWVHQVGADGLCHAVAAYRVKGEVPEFLRKHPIGPGRGTAVGRVMSDGRMVHIHDVLSDSDYTFAEAQKLAQYRTVLCVPLLREGVPIGTISLLRPVVQPFTDKQIELVTTFADQAVIAIENVRLFDEVKARERDLSEALERQTATADILSSISGSMTDARPVFEAIVRNLRRLFGVRFSVVQLLRDDGIIEMAAVDGDPGFDKLMAYYPRPLDEETMGGQAMLSRRTVQYAPVRDNPAAPAATRDFARAFDFDTVIFAPMIRAGKVIGAVGAGHHDATAFDERHAELIRSFADQAVIAIENVRLFNETKEALERQTAAANVLHVIANSPTDVQPVLQTVADTAARLCGASHVFVTKVEGDRLVHAAVNGATNRRIVDDRFSIPVARGSVVGRAVAERRTIHVPNLAAVVGDYPNSPANAYAEISEVRSILATPLLRESVAIGGIAVTRNEVRPFTEKQIELIESFAAQAVIAIENVRLFDEVQARTRELSEALEQQTATSEVLNVISSSRFQLQPVFDTIVETATRLCRAEYSAIFRLIDDRLHVVAGTHAGADFMRYMADHPFPADRGTAAGRCVYDGRSVRIDDCLEDPHYTWREGQRIGKFRSVLSVPLLREGTPIGSMSLMRSEVNPFTDKQMELVTTFADQAVIAIENARLFEEVQARTEDLAESLRQQTATADVLKLISRSTFDLETVLRTLVESAARLCEADKATITRQKDGRFYRAESYGFSDEFMHLVRDIPVQPERGTGTGRALLEGRIIHIPDVDADPDYSFGEARRLGDYRTLLSVPMLKEGVPIGVLSLTRSEVRPFTQKQIELVSTFADQAAIAIENVRLFESVEARTRELGQSLDDLRAAQDRLIQTEKLASLGQLTAGIAHEIKNPLNFVNNFSAVSMELVNELRDALAGATADDETRAEIAELGDLLRGNLEKIVQHGKRADSIVKNMLLHSRQGSGERRAVDINAIVEESLNLAYHGARAERKGFNITLERALDPAAGEVDLYPQEITRVLLNLISNGFYAATKRKGAADGAAYEPTLSAATRDLGDRVEIRIRDNGTGIPQDVRDKIFNPFFTTKPAGEGTGLGLSLSHDIIVKQHGGTIEVDTLPGEFTEFIIVLPRAAAALAQAGERP